MPDEVLKSERFDHESDALFHSDTAIIFSVFHPASHYFVAILNITLRH